MLRATRHITAAAEQFRQSQSMKSVPDSIDASDDEVEDIAV